MIVFDTNIQAKGATTQYTDFEFDSMATFGKKILCASDAGLFVVDKEQGDFISYFEPLTMDFGISNSKRLRAVYIGYESPGDLTLSINTEMEQSRFYTIPATTPGQHARKVVVSRALKGRYWTFQIYSNGVMFSVDDIKVLPIVRGHGFGGN